MKKTGILFVIDSFVEMGGAEKNLIQVVTGLDKETYTPRVCCLQGGRLVDSLRISGIPVTNLNMKRIYDFKGIREGIRLFAYLRRERIKIVVTYHESSDFWAGVIAKLASVPVVISNRRDMGYQLKPRHIAIYRVLNRIFDKIIVVSNAVGDMVAQKQSVPQHTIVTIYNGIETGKYLHKLDSRIKESLGLANAAYPVIGLTASIRRIKGIEYFIEAASLVRQALPDVYFLVVGYEGDPVYSEEIGALITKLGLQKHLFMTGVRSDIPEILPAIDIGVISSTTEGFSNSILEYMAAGKPVVATKTGGNLEAVSDDETGILVPPRDSRRLADALLRLLNDPDLRRRMGEAGRERARTHFSLEAMHRNIDFLYKALLDEKEACRDLLPVKPGAIRHTIAQTAKVTLAHSVRRSRPPRSGVTILAYHRVHDDPFDPLTMAIRGDIFEAHIRHIRKSYNPISLEIAVNLMQEGKEIPEHAIVLTFDDGYRDNFTNAYPILKRYGVPATIFLSVGTVEDGTLLWYDEIVEAVRKTPAARLDAGAYGLGMYSLNTLAERMQISKALVVRAKYMDKHQRAQFMRTLRAALRYRPGDSPRNMLSWDEINLMKKNGISFESHGMTHSTLTALSPEACDYEFLESKNLIFHNTGYIPAFYSYPDGSRNDYNNETIEHLKNCGYIAACTLLKGTNINTPLFELRRYCITPGMLMNPLNHYSPRLLDMKITDQ